jgi:hypothetical protein
MAAPKSTDIDEDLKFKSTDTIETAAAAKVLSRMCQSADLSAVALSKKVAQNVGYY